MKKLLTVSVASFAIAAMADYAPITVGVTEISATSQNMIVPVPYKTIGGTTDVSVHDLVKAANLPTGTKLYYYNSGTYYAWEVKSSAWSPVDVASTLSGTRVTGGSSEYNVAVGSALWVSFASAPDSEQKIYVYGKPAGTLTSTIVKNKTNLLSNPTTSTVDGSTLAGKITADKKDVILPIGTSFSGYYVYNGSKWIHFAPGESPAAVDALPDLAAYQGFWYVSKTSGDNATINW